MPWKPEFQSDLARNILQPFPLPNDASEKNWLQSAHWLRRYSCLKMLTHRHTDTQTTGRLVYFSSGELKIKNRKPIARRHVVGVSHDPRRLAPHGDRGENARFKLVILEQKYCMMTVGSCYNRTVPARLSQGCRMVPMQCL